MYIVLYYGVGYRRKVVMNNLINSFPQKNYAELEIIEKEFYRHLCDLIVEGIKLFSISESELRKRMVHRNADIIQQYFHQKQSVVLAGGHYGNWEMYALSIPMNIGHQTVASYTPLKSAFFNHKFKQSRSRFGLQMKPGQWILRQKQEHPDKPLAFIFATDQSPMKRQAKIWTTFLNQPTAVQVGAEKTAEMLNAPIIYGVIRKKSRGYYEVSYELISRPENEKHTFGYLTGLHTQKLERDIMQQPEIWLWSHKRWKLNPENDQ
jgi:Kdo2-lipid IVA lauroyltransferase/acyltransferase